MMETMKLDCGAGTTIKEMQGTSFQTYQSYLSDMEQKGFQKYVENIPENLKNCVWTATFVKKDQVITVSYMMKQNKMYVTEGKNIPLSHHLIYQERFAEQNEKNVKTKLHMPELHTYGNSFIIQLKNGHFILDDGGMPADTLYLLDYLEQLVPKGEKPIIEGWFISHGHGDHFGPLCVFDEHPEYTKRIIVEGIYFSETADSGETVQQGIRGMRNCRTGSGDVTPIYRPQTGQRYYFNDITIDVLHTQEQLPMEKYQGGFNESSTWLLYTIEGQTFLHGGDAGRGAIEVVKETYDKELFDFDIMATFHHGQNVYDSYVDYFNYKTVLYTTFVIGSQTANWHLDDNLNMQQRAKECLSWGDGTKILTFPYQVGTAESLPMKEWLYHPDRNTPKLY